MVSRDRAMYVFSESERRIKSRSVWQVPLALAVSLFATLLTASFTDSPWINGSTIKGMFLTFGLLSLGWLAFELWRLFTIRNVSPEKFIEDLAAGTEQAEIGSSVSQQSSSIA
jgi:hypothetical protein